MFSHIKDFKNWIQARHEWSSLKEHKKMIAMENEWADAYSKPIILEIEEKQNNFFTKYMNNSPYYNNMSKQELEVASIICFSKYYHKTEIEHAVADRYL